MPLSKLSPDLELAPARHWTTKQIQLYFATNGFGRGIELDKRKAHDPKPAETGKPK